MKRSPVAHPCCSCLLWLPKAAWTHTLPPEAAVSPGYLEVGGHSGQGNTGLGSLHLSNYLPFPEEEPE